MQNFGELIWNYPFSRYNFIVHSLIRIDLCNIALHNYPVDNFCLWYIHCCYYTHNGNNNNNNKSPRLQVAGTFNYSNRYCLLL